VPGLSSPALRPKRLPDLLSPYFQKRQLKIINVAASKLLRYGDAVVFILCKILCLLSVNFIGSSMFPGEIEGEKAAFCSQNENNLFHTCCEIIHYSLY
jgi:hypothetical protein